MRAGYVYAIGIETIMLVKIGRAKSPRKRLNAMQTGLPFKLEILYTLKVENPALVERTLHAMLDKHGQGLLYISSELT